MNKKKLVIKVTEKSLTDERSPENPAGMSGGGNCGSGGGQSGGNCGGGGKCA